MIYSKTAKGTEVLQTRSVALPPRQRTALLLTDGKRSAQDVLRQTAGLGSTPADIEALVALGLIEMTADDAPATHGPATLTQPMSRWQTGSPGSAAPDGPRDVDVPLQPRAGGDVLSATPAGLAELSSLPEAERFKRAYQIATELTSHMGFTGFRLQLTIEKATNLIDLGELRPRLLDGLEKSMGKNEALRKLREFDQLTGQ